MDSRRRSSWRSVALAAMFVAGCFARSLPAQQVGRAPLEVLVLEAPALLTALGRPHLVYELHVTNFGAHPVTLAGLEVVGDDGALLAKLTQAQLSQRMVLLGGEGRPVVESLPPGARAVAYMWLTLGSARAIPQSIVHRLRAAAGGGAEEVITTAAVPIRRGPVAVAAPVSGGPWVAVRGPSNSSPHRLSFVTMNGAAHVPQRFAVDWVRLGDDGRFFEVDGADVRNWHGYDEPVYAASEGTVVLARDGAPDRQPLDRLIPATTEASDAPGNVIVIDMGGGVYASYAHLKAGSLKVRQGDRISAGQVVARVGSSGNSLAPHLHFQVSNAVEPLAGEGLPFALQTFTLVGRVSSLATMLSGGAWSASDAQPTRQVTDELPLEDMVVRFP